MFTPFLMEHFLLLTSAVTTDLYHTTVSWFSFCLIGCSFSISFISSSSSPRLLTNRNDSIFSLQIALIPPLSLLPSPLFKIYTYSFRDLLWLMVKVPSTYWESQFLGRLIRSLGSQKRRKGSEALKEEIGVWNSQGGGKDKLFSSTFFSLSHIKCFFL